MSELFDTIEMKADQKKKEARSKAEAEKAAQAHREEEHRRAALAKRKRATRSIVFRVLTFIALTVALWLAGKFELMHANLIMSVYAAAFAWLCLWIGGWAQFMWCKGGLFEC